MKRRKILELSSAAALGLLLPNTSCNQPKKLGVALVGLGYYSTDLLAPGLQLTDHCELRGIVTGSPEKVARWQQQYNISDRNVYSYDTMHKIADNDDIDVIYIVLPNVMHAEYAIKAANTGKHVWCEKPMARTVEECQAIIDACRKNHVQISIGYRMQHEPNTQTIINYSKEPVYGRIMKVRTEAGYRDRRFDHWRLYSGMGGGATYDMGVYCINAARYVTGMEPIAVTARASTNRPEIYTEVDETMDFILEFDSGAIANCRTSFGMGLNELRVDCDKGWYELRPFQAYGGIRGRTSDGTLLNAHIPNQQAKQMDNDALAIINNEPVLVPGEEGLADIRIVEAIYKSDQTNSRVTI